MEERQAHRFNRIEWWKHLLKLRYADDAEQTKFHLNGTKVNAKTTQWLQIFLSKLYITLYSANKYASFVCVRLLFWIWFTWIVFFSLCWLCVSFCMLYFTSAYEWDSVRRCDCFRLILSVLVVCCHDEKYEYESLVMAFYTNRAKKKTPCKCVPIF